MSVGVMGISGFDDWNEFPRIQKWFEAMEKLPYINEYHKEPFKLNKAFYEAKVNALKR